jgi:tricorn protease
VYDNLHFDLNFPRGMKPYLITLQKDAPSPFVPVPKPLSDEKPKQNDKTNGQPKASVTDEPNKEPSAEVSKPNGKEESNPDDKKDKPIQIDVEGIEQRVLAFPVEEGIYGQIVGSKGKTLYTRYPVDGALNQNFLASTPSARGWLYLYDFEEQKEDFLVGGIGALDVSLDASTVIYRSGNRLRVLKAGAKPDDKETGTTRKSGWLDLNRVRVSVEPALEWRQMVREAWRLQRDQFWTSDMSQVDWVAVYERYSPLVERVCTRSEFSDLMWEMQGELGTSHAYEFGGDYRPEPEYRLGYLGADFTFDETTQTWRIAQLVQGDPWDERRHSPLLASGVNMNVGDQLLAIGGRALSRTMPPQAALVHLAEQEVVLTVKSGEAEARTITVKTLTDETALRYREWVEANRRFVHEQTQGRVGYVHVPDMGARGYAEFHRGYLAEFDREGLVVDVRYNGGGHVSPLILEKLARRRIGYNISRWGEFPGPYPTDAARGAMVALTNEWAGSDGDIFSHGFKLMKLGPLLGKRTWGGVIGINPRHVLADGTVTTQPEYSFWFQDVGWGVENYGTDPDIEIDNTPQDYVAGKDAQLERALAEVLKLLEANPPQVPKFDERPSRALPRLPKI